MGRVGEKGRRALHLRKRGATYEQIAEIVGYASRSSAHRAVAAALRESPRESPADAHDLDAERLDQLMQVLWPKALQGDEQAVDRILRIVDMRAGLTRPGEALRTAVGPVTDAVRKDLAALPEQLQRTAHAATALELAGLIERGVSPAACTKELRAVLADLTSRAASGTVATGGIADLTARIAARRRAAAD